MPFLSASPSTSSATFVQAAAISCNTFRSSAVCTNFARRRHSSANFFGTVLMTVPRENNHLSRRDVPEN